MPAPASPRSLIAVVLLLAACALLAWLGTWQLRRADEARAVGERFVVAAEEPPLTMPPSDLQHDALRFRRIELDGEYAAERQFLLDNMVQDGVAGYHVLTPLDLGGERRVLVNRGWVPAGGDRAVLPEVSIDSGLRVVRGRLERLPRAGLKLGDAEDHARSSSLPVAVVEFPTAAELAARIGRPLYDYQLLLDAAEPEGYVRDWHAPGIGPARHLVYAGQWLLLAVGAAAAAVGVGFRAWRASGART